MVPIQAVKQTSHFNDVNTDLSEVGQRNRNDIFHDNNHSQKNDDEDNVASLLYLRLKDINRVLECLNCRVVF